MNDFWAIHNLLIISDFLHKIICNKETGNITCGGSQTLDIHEAWFGRVSDDICVEDKKGNSASSADQSSSLDESLEFAANSISENANYCVNNQTWSFQKTTKKCQGQQFCKFKVITNNWYGEDRDPCEGWNRYLYIKYRCVQGKSHILQDVGTIHIKMPLISIQIMKYFTILYSFGIRNCH